MTALLEVEGLVKHFVAARSVLGRPTAYVIGEEGGGAFIAGVRYGSGRLYLKHQKAGRVYWHGPSVGYDFGASGSKTLFLIYGLHETRELYSGFSGIDGSAYFIGGAGITFLSNNKVIMAPIRTGLGFRLAAGGAQEYFGIRADMVTYGKSLAGGLPVGMVCGTRDLMRRFRDDRPADVCFARGTFNSHPYVMTAMDEFLSRLASPNFNAVYQGLDDTWNGRANALNDRLAAEELPVRVGNLSSIWTVHYTEPSRYNWMLQYYLRAEGLALSWVGTGRLIFTLNFTDTDFGEVADRFVAASAKMKRDGWWWQHVSLTNRNIKRRILREMLAKRFGR